MAINSFKNMGSLIREKQDADAAVKQARKEALSAPSNEFKARVAALREAEQRRAETTSTLKTFSSDFINAGVELDPSQVPPTLGERIGQGVHNVRSTMATGANAIEEGVKGTAGRVGQKAQEMGSNVAAGVTAAKEGVYGAAGYVASEVGSKIEAAKETGQRLVERGRESLRQLFEASVSSLNQAQEVGQARFDDVRSRAEATGGRAAGGISKLSEMWKRTKEGITQRASSAWEAASVWTNQRRQEIATRISAVQEGADQMLARARNSAAERIDGFNQAMRSAGESAKVHWDEISESVKTFATEQAKRVEDATTKVSEKVKTEVATAVGKGKIFLEPAWESIQKDRERIRQERNVYGEKLGIMVEGVSDVASPIIDRILDEGRDLRDAALGFSGKQIQGLQAFGRNIAGGAVEVGSPAWNFLVERWENLRLRANESRVRLNTFMEAVLGGAGNRFVQLRESTAERAKRTSSVLSGVKIEGGRILQNGMEVSREVAEWFVQNGTAAREFLLSRKEQIGQGVDMLRRYWEVYAVGKWKESGLTDVDIKRRMKLLRATGAASLGRAASISAAAGIEGAVMLQSLARDRRGQVALSLVALGVALAVNPELRQGIQHLLTGIDLSGAGLHLPNIDLSHLGGIDTSAVGTHHAGGVDLGNLPVDSSSIPTGHPGVDVGSSMPTYTPDVGAAGVTPGHVISPDVSQGVSAVPTPGHLVSPDVTQAIPSTPTPDITSTLPSSVPTPDIVGHLPNLDMITPGHPFEVQARQLAGGVNENYYNILQSGFDQFKDNFSTTAQAIVNHPSNYTPEQVSLAQQQLEAVAKLNSDPTLAQGSQGWYDTIMKATHFWRPV